jgi:hypothetical protein
MVSQLVWLLTAAELVSGDIRGEGEGKVKYLKVKLKCLLIFACKKYILQFFLLTWGCN